MGKYYTINNTTKGMSQTREYNIYTCMLNRCFNPLNNSYSYYGEKNITICERWLSNFKYFIEDMGICPIPNGSIDRIDRDKGYSLENCRWVTPSQQQMNQGLYKNNMTGFKGVALSSKGHRLPYIVQITKNYHTYHLGYTATVIEGARLYDKIAIRMFGEFAETNESLGNYKKNDRDKQLELYQIVS